MPYTIQSNGDKYCVYKKNEDGSAGDMVANTCHAKKQDAIDQMVAIEYSEKIQDKAYDVIIAEQQYSLAIVAEALAYGRRFDEALQVIDKIAEVESKVRLLAMLGYMLSFDDLDRAKTIFDQALALVRTIEREESRAYAYVNLVQQMVNASFVDEARVVAEEMKVKKTPEIKTYVTFKQDAQGDWWFIGLYSNKYIDRDEEILSEKAHQKYVEWVKETGIKPPVILMHMPKHLPGFWYQVMQAHNSGMITTKTLNNLLKDFYKDYALAETEKVFYANGFTGVAAKVYNDKQGWVKNLINYPEKLGMSHGFIPMEMDGNIYNEYRAFEFSVLPLKRAANVYTSIRLMEENEMPLEKDVQEFLDEIQNGTAEEVDVETQDLSTELEEKGVEFKEADVQKLVEAMKWNEFVELVKTRFDEYHAVVAEFVDKLDAFEKRLDQVEKSEDEKVADLIKPNYAQLLPSPTTSPDNVIDKAKQPEVFDFISALMKS